MQNIFLILLIFLQRVLSLELVLHFFPLSSYFTLLVFKYYCLFSNREGLGTSL